MDRKACGYLSLSPLLFPAPGLSFLCNLNQTPKSSRAGPDQDPQTQGGETTLSLKTSSPNLPALQCQ